MGGVVALAAIGALMWFLRRKKKSESHVQFPAEVDGAGPSHSHPPDVKFTYSGHLHEAGGDEYRQEMGTPNPAPSSAVKSALGGYRQELYTDSSPGVPPVELYGGDVPNGRRP